ncbi:MAG TPA: hypothetical protein VFQ41_16615 [Candidatus Angelobacter sp.]|nr:hypothetical protein [Candidatus Angelobacter sp.]
MSSSNSPALESRTDTTPSFTTPGRYGTRLQLGGYIADILPDPEQQPPIHHCIVQRIGCAQVLYLGQEKSFAAALECGHRHLEELAAAHRDKHGAIYEFATIHALK